MYVYASWCYPTCSPESLPVDAHNVRKTFGISHTVFYFKCQNDCKRISKNSSIARGTKDVNVNSQTIGYCATSTVLLLVQYRYELSSVKRITVRITYCRPTLYFYCIKVLPVLVLEYSGSMCLTPIFFFPWMSLVVLYFLVSFVSGSCCLGLWPWREEHF